jgi:hypothetical protein
MRNKWNGMLLFVDYSTWSFYSGCNYKTYSIEPKAHAKAGRKATNVMPPADRNVETFARCKDAFDVRCVVELGKAFREVAIIVYAQCFVKINLASIAHVHTILIHASWVQMQRFSRSVKPDVFVSYDLCEDVVVWIGVERRDGTSRSEPCIQQRFLKLRSSFDVCEMRRWCRCAVAIIRNADVGTERWDLSEEVVLG